MQVGGFVLAGGRSSRMGRDKALLPLEGETLVERALRGLSGVCAEVAIAGGGTELMRFGRVIPDERAGCGPLGGIVAALEQSAFEWNCVLAVDVPFLPAEAWQRMLLHIEGCDAVALLPRVDGAVQPLCGVYRRSCVASLRRELMADRWKVRGALEAAGRVELLDFAEAAWFRNVNTPEDFATLGDAGDLA